MTSTHKHSLNYVSLFGFCHLCTLLERSRTREASSRLAIEARGNLLPGVVLWLSAVITPRSKSSDYDAYNRLETGPQDSQRIFNAFHLLLSLSLFLSHSCESAECANKKFALGESASNPFARPSLSSAVAARCKRRCKRRLQNGDRGDRHVNFLSTQGDDIQFKFTGREDPRALETRLVASLETVL